MGFSTDGMRSVNDDVRETPRSWLSRWEEAVAAQEDGEGLLGTAFGGTV